jgi:acyl-coenzyme A synthetase/AMP-(fatty) acid ligase
MVSSQIETLLDAFLHTARSPSSTEDRVVECGSEQWTYGDLDSISTGLALELHQLYGSQPTVAVLSENHPYTFALLLATWKLGGIFAPLDHNSPPDMIKQMAENIQPTCALVPEDMDVAKELFSGKHCFCQPLKAEDR